MQQSTLTERAETIHGTYLELIRPCGGANDGCFSIRTNEGGLVICTGISPNLHNGTPIIVTGNRVNTNHRTIKVCNIAFDYQNRPGCIELFRSYPGVGEKRAGKIYSRLSVQAIAKGYLQKNKGTVTGDFSQLTEEAICQVLSITKMSAASKIQLADAIHGLSLRMTLYHKLKEYGGSFSEAEYLYDLYREEALQILKDQTYAAMKNGVSFGVCDHIAKGNGMSRISVNRIEVILDEALKRISNHGSTCCSMKEFLESIRKVEKRGAFEPLSDAMYLSGMIGSNHIKTVVNNDKLYYMAAYSYQRDRRIAQELHRLEMSSEPTSFSGYHGEKELDEDQRAALYGMKKTGVKIVTGGPGAGKTTLIREFILEYQRLFPELTVKLCAPTGRAAVRIMESSGFPAQTIHKLLGIRPFEKKSGQVSSTYDQDHPLPKGLYIIDEMSMVGEELFLHFVESVPNGSMVILSGDPRQLKSVEAGNVLEDIIQSNLVDVYHLTRIHRQNEGNSILENYHHIKDHRTDLVLDDSFQIIPSENRTDMLSILDELRGKYETSDPYSFQILSFSKKGVLGVTALNQHFASQRNGQNESDHFLKRDFSIADKIMMTANNYENGYWNGDIGVITEFREAGICAKFYDGIRFIPNNCMNDVDHAWAITTHKSQGSEYRTVAIVMDDEVPNMLYNSIILTAITRAKNKVFVVCRGKSLHTAITQTAPETRTTALSAFLQKGY